MDEYKISSDLAKTLLQFFSQQGIVQLTDALRSTIHRQDTEEKASEQAKAV